MTAQIKYTATGQPTPALPSVRKEAIRMGANAYFTGRPCSHGHVSHRYTKTGQCSKCANSDAERRASNDSRPADVAAIARAKTLKKWNASPRAYTMKLRWKEADPKWAWAVSAVGGMRIRGKQSGVPVEVDKEYLYAILTDTCPVFGTPFVFLGAGRVHNESPTVDRLDPAKGYIRGNIVVISQRANAIKSNAGWRQIRRVADWLRTYTSPAVDAAAIAEKAAGRGRYAYSAEGERSRAAGIAALAIHNTGARRAKCVK